MTDNPLTGRSFAKVDNQLSVSLAGDEIVLQMTDGVYFSLNATGKDLWSKLDKPCSYEEMVDYLLEHYDVGRTPAEECVQEFVSSLLGYNLIEERTAK